MVDAVVAAEYCGKSGKNRRRVHPLLRSSASALRMEGGAVSHPDGDVKGRFAGSLGLPQPLLDALDLASADRE